MRYLLVPIVTLALVASLLSMSGAAEAQCKPPRPNDGDTSWVGEIQYMGYPTGISAMLRSLDPYVSSATHPVTGTVWGQASTMWVMLAGDSQPNDYAQVGWVEYTNSPPYSNVYNYLFYEHGVGNTSFYHRNLPKDLWPPPPDGESWAYQVTREDVIPGYWTFRIGLPRLDGKPAPAVGYGVIDFSPNHGEIMGEITSSINQMPGQSYYYSQEWVQATAIKSYSTWYAFNGFRFNSNDNWFSWQDMPPHYQYGGGAFAIWDTCQG